MTATVLDEWERKLSQQMASVSLIGELDLSAEATREIGQLIRDLICSEGPAPATERLRKFYPYTFVSYLVFQGLYRYTEGDFWAALCEDTGLPHSPNHTLVWGQAFEAITEDLGLSRSFAGHRYVGAILGHGGIPTASLPDFFNYMLQPSVTKPEWAGLSTRELIEEWLTRSSHYFVDKPVLRFLEYGGRVAEDFVERCRQMARESLDAEQVSSALELGLSESIVRCYQSWLADKPQPKPKTRLRRPKVILDPWGLGVQILLPEQPTGETRSQAKISWEIVADGEVYRVSVRVRRVDLDLKAESASVPLPKPAREYHVRFLADNEPLGEWMYAGADDAHPFLVFDADSRILLPHRERLPKRLLWVLCGAGVELHSEPVAKAFIQERLPRLPWEWQDWTGYAIDPSDIRLLELHSLQRAHPIVINVEDRDTTLPELVMGVQVNLAGQAVPLYVGRPPRLRIWRKASSPDSGLTRWHFELHHEWEALPQCNIRQPLNDLADLLYRDAEYIELPLDHPTLLGESPVGQYRLLVRGPLGSSTELQFRIVPRLFVTGHEPLYLPDTKHGARPVQLLIETDIASRIECLQTDCDWNLQQVAEDNENHLYQIDVAPHPTDVSLRLVYDFAPGRAAYIPFHIPIRRLRWLLVLRPAQLAHLDWQSRPIRVSLEELERSEYPYLFVEIPDIGMTSTSVELRLVGIDGAELRKVPITSSGNPSRFCRFDLRLVREDLRQSTSPVVRADLVIGPLSEQGIATLPVLIITKGLYIEQIAAIPKWEQDELCLKLDWQPPIPLKGCYIRFWSCSRPWADPVEFPLLDSTTSSYTVSTTADAMPAGDYLLQFMVHDPWIVEAEGNWPESSAPNVFSINVGTLEQRLDQLDRAIARDGACFTTVSECAVLHCILSDEQGTEADLRWCYEHIENAPLEQALNLVGRFGDRLNARALQIRLFKRVEQVHQAFRNGKLGRALFQSYLEHLKSFLIHFSSPLPQQMNEALLALPDDQIRLTVAWRLITQSDAAGLDIILAWIERGEIADAGAVELLGCNPAFSARVLAAHARTPITQRLIEELSKTYPDQVPVAIIRPGYWLRCQAGWGRIMRIETQQGQAVSFVHRDDLSQGYSLHVALRADETETEFVIVDTARNEVTFGHTSQFYMCSECGHFASRSKDLIRYKHGPAGHGGDRVAPSFVNGASLHQLPLLHFAVRRPSNPWE